MGNKSAEEQSASEMSTLIQELRIHQGEVEMQNEALRKSEQEKKAVLDSLLEHVIYQDREMKILWANKAACESVSKKREDLLGRYCYEVWADRRSPCDDCPITKARDTEQPQTVEKKTPDGRWWYIQGSAVRDDDGHVIGATEVTLDITDRKRAEAALRNAKDELETKVAERTAELTEANKSLRKEIEERKRAEKDLHETQKLLSNTFNALQDLLVVIDKDLRVRMSNWKDHDYILEKDRQGHPYCYEVFMKRNKPCHFCPAIEVFTTGKIKQLEGINPIDGKIRDIRVLPIFDDEGRVVSVIEHIRDVTERKQAEQAFIENVRRYRELFDNLKSGVAVYQPVNDGGDFIFVDFNKAGEQIDNLKRQDLIGKNLLERFPGVKKLGVFDVLQRVYRTGKPEHYPVRLYMDGRISGWRENFIYKLSSAEIVAIYEDVTDRKEAEEALRESEQRFKSIFENAPIGFYRTTPDGRVLDANPALIHMLGYASFEALAAINLETHEFQPEYPRRQFKKRIQRDGEIKGMEAHWKRPDGTFAYLRENAKVFRDANGNTVCYEGTVEDLTDQKQAEKKIHTLSQQLIQAQEAERQMISRELHDRVAQDLSTLKIGIDSFVDDEPSLSSKVRKAVSEYSEILRKSISFVRDLSYDLHPPGLAEMGLIRTLAGYCEEFAEKSRVTVNFEPIGMRSFCLDTHTAVNLYRLVQEGLNNIRKHAHASQAIVKLVGTYPHIILGIEDNGRGFDVEERAAAADRQKRMGLRSMAERVALMQGEMRIHSQPMKGTRIFIKFPYPEKKHGSKENHTDR